MIKKKDLKVEEINNMLTNEVNPKLEELHEDMKLFEMYNKNLKDLERKEKVLVAFKYNDLKKQSEDPTTGAQLE